MEPATWTLALAILLIITALAMLLLVLLLILLTGIEAWYGKIRERYIQQGNFPAQYTL